jgi:hypothetical protein
MGGFIAKWWDVVLFAVLLVIHVAAWTQVKAQGQANQPGRDDDARRSAAQLMTSSSAVGITAVSILVPASMLIVAGNTQFPSDVILQLFRAGLWFLGSLIMGLWVVFIVPLRSMRLDVRTSLEIAIPFGPQVFALMIGMGRLIWGLYLMELAKGG